VSSASREPEPICRQSSRAVCIASVASCSCRLWLVSSVTRVWQNAKSLNFSPQWFMGNGVCRVSGKYTFAASEIKQYPGRAIRCSDHYINQSTLSERRKQDVARWLATRYYPASYINGCFSATPII